MNKLWSFWSALPSWVHVSLFLVSLYYIASQSVVYVEPGNISIIEHSCGTETMDMESCYLLKEYAHD